MKEILLTVQHNRKIAVNVFEIKLNAEDLLPSVQCGQFIHLEVPGQNLILRRPFCIYKSDRYSVTVTVAMVGKGTDNLSNVQPGDKLKAILPLGNGFYLEPQHQTVLLIGGSIGCAPLLSVTKQYPDRTFYACLGFKSKDYVLFEADFQQAAQTMICTYDGSYGTKGYQIPVLEPMLDKIKPDVILACGSRSMIKSVKTLSETYGIPAFMSNEQHMGCGVGACLVCTCKVRAEDGFVHNKRVCMDGPVFDLKDVVL